MISDWTADAGIAGALRNSISYRIDGVSFLLQLSLSRRLDLSSQVGL